MSKAIKCDRCGKFDDSSMGISCLKREDINFADSFREGWYPDEVDLCGDCSKELLDFIKHWVEFKKGGKR